MNDFIKGMDLSTLLEVESCGGRFYDEGRQADALEILKNYGMNLVRLRLWNDPYSEDGIPYGAGTNDLACTMQMAARLKAVGIPWMLDFHYSDFWADPGKQILPKAWINNMLRRCGGFVFQQIVIGIYIIVVVGQIINAVEMRAVAYMPRGFFFGDM